MIYYKDLKFVNSELLWMKLKWHKENAGLTRGEIKRICGKHGYEYKTFWQKLCLSQTMWLDGAFFNGLCDYVFRKPIEFDTTDEDVQKVLRGGQIPAPIKEYIESDIDALTDYMCRKNISSISTIAKHIVNGKEARMIINTNSKTIIKYIIKRAVRRVNSMTGSEKHQHMNTVETQREKYENVPGKYKFVKSYPNGFNLWQTLHGRGTNATVLLECFSWNINPNIIARSKE